ncbi:efflux RND transporter periplasmic adaptor subunit [Martelella mediterranea]|uniref:Acriflavine resistance protein A n=1 Tax=Martelella mediterranea DSM 17316 TaxID=1122214 RepID=A0A1U9YWV5_9HYPH|nr:efflux RND transporter periplasmic adaptor subunit [Martelella mediterranea]AQZ49931.1 Acriflavine resistance protein A precursor [Martelella mediterranea DSM 17316]
MPNPVSSFLALILVACAVAAAPAAAQQQMPPKKVGVVELKRENVPRIVTLPGRAVAVQRVGIRPRVSGTVTEILYREGTTLEAGDPMFRIDDTTYQAALASAEADVSAATAAQSQARLAYERADRLVGQGLSQAELESRKADLERATAQLKAAEAALDVARAELGWTTVRSPIAGVASVATVSIGDLVSAAQADALATVIQLDPIDVDMYEPSTRILRVVDDIEAGLLDVHDTLSASLTLENGRSYDFEGELLSPGFTVSMSTGAVDRRFRFDNPDHLLLPGMFVRGSMEIGTMNAILVSQSAATRDRSGQLTAWVLEDGKAAQRKLVETGTYQNQWIVVEGVRAGDQLIVDGFQNLRVGMDVVPVAVEYDAAGVIREQSADAGSSQPPSQSE